MRNRSVLAAVALLAAAPAFAQQETEPEQPKKIREVYAKETVINFDETVLTISEKKPASAYFLGRSDEAFETQIDERVHFKKDLAKSIGVRVKLVETATTN